MSKIITQIEVTREVWSKVKAQATIQAKTVNDVVEEMLAQSLENQKTGGEGNQ